jgi:hypothetical protein
MRLKREEIAKAESDKENELSNDKEDEEKETPDILGDQEDADVIF